MTMTTDTCREIAGRIWCDPAFEHQVMDVVLCEKIAQQLYQHAAKAEAEAVAKGGN